MRRRKSRRAGAPLFIVAAMLLLAVWAVDTFTPARQFLETFFNPHSVGSAVRQLPVDDIAAGPDSLQVHVLDCGQADAMIIVQNQTAMLVDAGEQVHGDMILQYLEALGIERLDYFVMTHPHADHIGGAAAVLESIAVETVIMPDATHTTQLFERTLDALEASGADIRLAVPRDTYALGDASFTILSPIADQAYSDLNDYSVAFRLSYAGGSMLFTGDMGTLPEGEILDAGYAVRSDVLKAGHHGSRTASSQRFIDSVRPEIVIMTVAAVSNDNLPNAQILKRYEDFGAAIYRSDIHGVIVVHFDETGVGVYTERTA